MTNTNELITLATCYQGCFHTLRKAKLVEIAAKFGLFFQEYSLLDSCLYYELKAEYKQLSKKSLVEMLEIDANILLFWES